MGDFSGREAIIFAAAPETDYGYITMLLMRVPNAIIVCADGGLRHARKLGLTPQLMITDCDSLNETAGQEVIRLTPEKDDTDMQACVRESIARGCRRLYLVCASGGRLDHMLANLSLLEEAEQLGAVCTLIDSQNEVFFHGGGQKCFQNNFGHRYFSIVPLDESLRGVTIQNAKYPLQDAVVARAGMITISNEALGDVVQITILEGKAYVVFASDWS